MISAMVYEFFNVVWEAFYFPSKLLVNYAKSIKKVGIINPRQKLNIIEFIEN